MKKTIILSAVAVMTTAACTAQSQGNNTSSQAAINDSIQNIIRMADQGDAKAQNLVGSWYFSGKNVQQDYEKAEHYWHLAANQGNALAMGNVGLCYQYGYGVEKDSIAALRLYIRSIKDGNKQLLEERTAGKNAFDLVLAAQCYQQGNGTTKDLNKAIGCYQKAVELQSPDAARELGLIYMNQKNAIAAAPVFKQGAQQGDLTCTYYYGKLLYDGQGVVQDMSQGVVYLSAAAEKGFAQAQVEMGHACAKGEGTAQNEEKAFSWYEKAAVQGNPHGQWNLAECYRKGAGTEASFTDALYWYARSAPIGYRRAFKRLMNENEEVKNSPFGSYVLGMKAQANKDFSQAQEAYKALEKAKHPLGKTLQAALLLAEGNDKANPKKGMKQLESLAETDALACFILAQVYANGRVVEKDMKRSFEYMKRASDKGIWSATCQLADDYLNGQGTGKNEREAVKLLLQAQKAGRLTPEACQLLASCYEEGYGGLNPDKKKADELRKVKDTDPIADLLQSLDK